MTVAELDEVTFDLEVDGEQVRRQLGRRVWEHAGWATVVCAFQERASNGDWKGAKVALVRFRRMHDAWQRQASITLRGADALEIAATIASWELDTADDPDGN